MLNIVQFNKTIYKGNINLDFYLYCLKKDIKLIRFLIYNIFLYLLSIIFKKYNNLYETNKYKYLKYIEKLEDRINEFYKHKNRYNNCIENSIDIIIDKVPEIFINDKLSKKIIAYKLDENYKVDLEQYNKQLLKIKECNYLYIRNSYELRNIKFKKLIIVKNNKMKFLNKRNIINDKLIKLLIIILLSLIITSISFCYTNYILDMKMIITYFEPKLFLLNFIPIIMTILLLCVISKRLHISFLITSFIVMALSIANQTKLLYRDDVVTFEDLTLFKEAMTMTTRYDIVIRWFTIIFVILLIIVYFFVKKYIKKFNINVKKQVLFTGLILLISIAEYKIIYKNEDIYNNVGDTSLINVWITTRQSQIRGLIYPFIYSIQDIVDTKPENYNEELAIELLNSYEYKNIPEDKKINIIAIMLEAYNDFSKFDTITFKEDIYEKLHSIQNNSISGKLVTTIFGGGTIVTERNFLTGYYNIPSLRKNTNSYVWYFKEQGYRTEAMHPIYGAFYNRASYNPNLGFDVYYNYENKFSSIQDDFLDDDMFFNYIIEGYEQSKKDNIPYFNFSVTYQNHGPYYDGYYEEKEYLIENNNYSESVYNTINEYFSGIKATNEAIEKLVNYFDNEEEPVIVILFGDHNPYLGDTGYQELGINLDLSTISGFENYYETLYIIHANNSAKEVFGKSFIEEGNTISPIFLMNELFDYIELEGNEYLQYMSDLKKQIDVISEYYYKVNGEFKNKEYNNLIDKYNFVNYYYSRNFRSR